MVRIYEETKAKAKTKTKYGDLSTSLLTMKL